RICLPESNRRKPPAQLFSVRVQRGEVLLIGDVACAGGHDEARPASLDALTKARMDLVEGHGHLIGSEEFPHGGQRLVEEDGPGGASGQGKEICAQIDLYKLGSCVLEFAQRLAEDAVNLTVHVGQMLPRRVGKLDVLQI